jgi:hypothetical protein
VYDSLALDGTCHEPKNLKQPCANNQHKGSDTDTVTPTHQCIKATRQTQVQVSRVSELTSCSTTLYTPRKKLHIARWPETSEPRGLHCTGRECPCLRSVVSLWHSKRWLLQWCGGAGNGDPACGFVGHW